MGLKANIINPQLGVVGQRGSSGALWLSDNEVQYPKNRLYLLIFLQPDLPSNSDIGCKHWLYCCSLLYDRYGFGTCLH